MDNGISGAGRPKPKLIGRWEREEPVWSCNGRTLYHIYSTDLGFGFRLREWKVSRLGVESRTSLKSTFAILTSLIRLFWTEDGILWLFWLRSKSFYPLRRALEQVALCRKATGKNEETFGGKVNLMQLSCIKVQCEKDRIRARFPCGFTGQDPFCSNAPAAWSTSLTAILEIIIALAGKGARN